VFDCKATGEESIVAHVEIEDLVVQYGANIAVRGIGLQVAEGEFVTLLGPSGCGKSSTLRCLAGLERATAGHIKIETQVIESAHIHVPPEKRDLNMVFQTYAVWPHMTVFDNVAYGLRARRMARTTVDEKTTKTLELVGLGDFAKRYGTELSGGQQQRVALARAIVTEPRVLLFDEPLSNLDALLRERMRNELVQLHRTLGTTTIYVTHDQTEAMMMSDRIAIMNEGRIVQLGAPRELYTRPSTRFTAEFIGVTNLLPGRVEDRDTAPDEPVTIRTPGGLVARGLPPADISLRHDQNVLLSVRPEDVTVEVADAHEASPGINTWLGQVVTVAYAGNRLESVVEVAGERLRVDLHPNVPITPGCSVQVRIPESSSAIVPSEDDTADSKISAPARIA
jgi:iron(III) transport system ATP-binding protein